MQQPVPASPKTSSIAYLTKNYANYNYWANKTLVDWLRTKPADVLAREVPSSFPSIQKTMVHYWQTQCFWLGIMREGVQPAMEPYTGSLEDIFDAVVNQSREMAEYIGSLTDGEIERPTLVKNPWFECNFPNFEYVVQVMNHSTYHRGQVITIGRNLGFTDAPMTDYNYYNVYGK
jgi:uncharacterized damage-inducible protein DinB